MSLVVKWEDIPDAAGYEIYRSKTKFSLSTLPTDKVSVPAGATEYEYTDVDRQTVYWFAIRTLDANGAGTFGQVFPLGYFPDTGPGPSTLLRGDWAFGFFGEVSPNLVGTADEVYAALVQTTADNPIKPTVKDFVYLKCIVNGKIVFIPSSPFGTYSVMGTSAHYISIGATGDAATLDDNTAPVIKLKGRDYRHRLPRASNSKPTGPLVNLDVVSDDVLMSEVGMLAALLLSAAETDVSKNPDNRNAAPLHYRLGDYPDLANVITLHRFANYGGNNNSLYSYVVTPSTGAIVSKVWYYTDPKAYLPVFELLF